MRSTTRLMALLAGVALVGGCQKSKDSQTERVEIATSVRPLDPCDPVNTDISMVVHDQATIGAADFSFVRTLTAIRNTSGGAATTDEDMVVSLLANLTATQFLNPESDLPMPVRVRTDEANMDAGDLLTQMRPVALFNRFDLAPSDGSNCGEYRIVYGKFPNTGSERFLLIFEAVLPNPNPGIGLQGCLPVAQFWHGLSDPGLTTAQRAQMLEDFYYDGLSGFSAVVTFANYGMPLGQVRANMFMMSPWELREWRTGFNVNTQPIFEVDTDKQNPLAEFYDETSSNPNPSLFASEQSAFLSDFTTVQMPILGTSAAPFPVSPRCDVVNGFGSRFANRFNEFMSVSQGSEDEPEVIASPAFEDAVDNAMGSIPLTTVQMLNRAGTVTCGGCHQFSNGKNIGLDANGNPATWPSSAGFVHVNESGTNPPAIAALSQALTECFLPVRRAILEDFVCDASNPPDAGVPDLGAPDSGADAGVPPDSGVVSCTSAYQCSPYEYCEFGPYNVCGASGPGVCTPRPSGCGYGSQVCGCDGQTYPSECHANQAGTDVASAGACGGCFANAPAGCCFADSDCGKGQECIGEVCMRRGGAGVCEPEPPAGYCWEDAHCGKGQFCDGEVICPCGSNCLRPDEPGVCRQLPSPGPTPIAELEFNEVVVTFLSAGSSNKTAALTELRETVEEVRAAEAAEAGAFFPVRRTH